MKLIEVEVGVFDGPVKAMCAFEKKYQEQFFRISKTVVNRSSLTLKNGFHFLRHGCCENFRSGIQSRA
ncbi:MAG: hypothetical protein QTN59_16920 [Candidatus Electrothrix communis]|nr:hypothetical protein [Desulfobulbus sp. US4]WLE96350.1 MAG: hypothetical protein QTN59_16920 [Candidatus Electrothrix communis]